MNSLLMLAVLIFSTVSAAFFFISKFKRVVKQDQHRSIFIETHNQIIPEELNLENSNLYGDQDELQEKFEEDFQIKLNFDNLKKGEKVEDVAPKKDNDIVNVLDADTENESKEDVNEELSVIGPVNEDVIEEFSNIVGPVKEESVENLTSHSKFSQKRFFYPKNKKHLDKSNDPLNANIEEIFIEDKNLKSDDLNVDDDDDKNAVDNLNEEKNFSNNIPRLNVALSTEIKPIKTKDESFSSFAVALKTGRETAADRVPIQLLTFLKKMKNVILIGESPVNVGNVIVEDVYTDLYKKEQDFKLLDLVKNNNTKATTKNTRKHLAITPMTSKLKDNSGNNKIIPDNNSAGWKADAHKNLPGFKLLYKNFPDAEWYFMIDDDTYIFFDNIYEQLSQLNPDDLHYIGNANNFVGCDKVVKMGDGIPFAHGGSGIVVSRGALKKMLTVVDSCISSYKDCWAGDVRTALCMRDAGILLEMRLPGFNSDPPNIIDGHWPTNPCLTPLSYHHLLNWQIQSLFDVEEKSKKSRNSLTTYSDILEEFRYLEQSFFDEKWKANTNRRGYDYRSVLFKGFPSIKDAANECYKLCLEEERCRSWVFDADKCWLKDGIPRLFAQDDSYSGVVDKEYMCNENK
ncbi:hypothetical protein HDU92_001367 [Lobulomyces angularis]|nr:hypothetical protein HDU92_001367 [Lobulomyces angularis]